MKNGPKRFKTINQLNIKKNKKKIKLYLFLVDRAIILYYTIVKKIKKVLL